MVCTVYGQVVSWFFLLFVCICIVHKNKVTNTQKGRALQMLCIGPGGELVIKCCVYRAGGGGLVIKCCVYRAGGGGLVMNCCV